MEKLLKIEDLYGGYGQTEVINGINFDVKEGDFFGIIGPNGSGKSTLLKLMSKVLHPSKGNVYFEDKNLNEIKLKSFCQKSAFVSQDTQINFSFSVWEIVLMGRIPHLSRLELETKKDFSIARKVLQLTNSLDLKSKMINELSAGERQRVIIAKALAQEPILLFLDEPTSHLDIGYQIQILDLLRKLNIEKKLTIIIVLHDLNLASEYCNRLILLDKGKIVYKGEPESVLNKNNIESIYKVKVEVGMRPNSLKPYITLLSKTFTKS